MAAGSTSAAKADPDEAARRRRRRRRVLLVGGAALAVLATAGAAGAAFGLKEEVVGPPPPPPLAVVTEPVAAPVFVRMDLLHIHFYMGNCDRRWLAVTARLEVDGVRRNDEDAYALMPRLREAFVRAMPERPLPGAAAGKPELVHIKNRMRAADIDIVGARIVADVLVQDIHYFDD